MTRDGRPITYPMTPYLGEGGTIDVSTGLAYPAKAERARANPKVGVLFSDPTGAGIDDPPTVLVQGVAAVRDKDLQANTDRYVERSLAKLNDAWKGVPWPLARRQRWYWVRIWIEITPVRALVWGPGEAEPREYRFETRALPASDPKPPGKRPPPWAKTPADWRQRIDDVLGMPPPVLSVVDAGGYPFLVRVKSARPTRDGFALDIGMPPPEATSDRGSLLFHDHPENFIRQDNAVFVGSVERSGHEIVFRVERALASFTLRGSNLVRNLSFIRQGMKIMPSLKREADRRGQPIPKVRRR